MGPSGAAAGARGSTGTATGATGVRGRTDAEGEGAAGSAAAAGGAPHGGVGGSGADGGGHRRAGAGGTGRANVGPRRHGGSRRHGGPRRYGGPKRRGGPRRSGPQRRGCPERPAGPATRRAQETRRAPAMRARRVAVRASGRPARGEIGHEIGNPVHAVDPVRRSACASRPSMLERRSPGNTDHHPGAWHRSVAVASPPGASGASGALPLLTVSNTVSPGSAWPSGFWPTTVPRSALLSVVVDRGRAAFALQDRAGLVQRLPDDVGDLRDRRAVEVARIGRRQRQHRLARPAAASSPRTTSAPGSCRRRCCRCRRRTASPAPSHSGRGELESSNVITAPAICGTTPTNAADLCCWVVPVLPAIGRSQPTCRAAPAAVPLDVVLAQPGHQRVRQPRVDRLLARRLLDRHRLAVLPGHRLDRAGRAPPARAGQRGADVGQLQHAGRAHPERERGLPLVLGDLRDRSVGAPAGVRVDERGGGQRLHAQPHRHVHHVRHPGELLQLDERGVRRRRERVLQATSGRRSCPRSAPGSAGRRRRRRSARRSRSAAPRARS